MSNLGLQILYEIVNRDERFLCERAFAPWTDMEAELRRYGTPLYGLETKHPLGDFDLLGFSLAYELDYSNVLNILDLAGVPLLASERGADDPIVLAGGSNTTNPEPLADFVDLFLIGEGEEAITELLETYDGLRGAGRRAPAGGLPARRRRDRGRLRPLPLPRAVPSGRDGGRRRPAARRPARCRSRSGWRTWWTSRYPARPVVPYVETVHDRAAIEIMRGCGRGCRFCQADMIYRPRRVRPREQIIQMAETLLGHTGLRRALPALPLQRGHQAHRPRATGRGRPLRRTTP